MIKTKKIVKPIEIDAHFKYRCPKCSIEHWISLNEAKTPNFKIVCDCKKVFSPKRIKKIQIIYNSQGKNKQELLSEQQIQCSNIQLESNVIEKCIPILVGYGFTKQESEELLNKAYQIDQSGDCGQLIKLALKSLGVDKNE